MREYSTSEGHQDGIRDRANRSVCGSVACSCIDQGAIINLGWSVSSRAAKESHGYVAEDGASSFVQKVQPRLTKLHKSWRCHPDSNRGMKVLQTFALPLGYDTL